jgi:G:T/U-mismatch repair DNA glycosylase
MSIATGKPYQFACHLRYGPDKILSYPEQLERLVQAGFCLWDVVQSCERPGSLDQDIRRETPNDVRAFCERHPSIRRIVFANGGTGCKLFVKHHRDWLASGQFVAATNEESRKAFGPALRKVVETEPQAATATTTTTTTTITLISALSVSPAAARHSYKEKRDFWDEFVYQPGLADLEKN